MKDTLVMKFGGTSVGSVEAIQQVIGIARDAKVRVAECGHHRLGHERRNRQAARSARKAQRRVMTASPKDCKRIARKALERPG